MFYVFWIIINGVFGSIFVADSIGTTLCIDSNLLWSTIYK